MTEAVVIGAAVQLAIGAAAYAIAANNSKKSPVKQLKGDPTTLSERGSYIPWFVGPRLVGPVIAWAGNRQIRNEKVSSAGKGLGSGPGSTTSIFYEEGIHVTGVHAGRVRSLRKILQSGETILQGPIFPETNPTGTIITLPKAEGILELRWGFDDDPIDTWAGDPGRVGILSAFPGMIRANWREKRLGQTANWSQIEYEYEIEPVDPTGTLSQADAWIAGAIEDITITEDGVSTAIEAQVVFFNLTAADEHGIGDGIGQNSNKAYSITILSDVRSQVFVGSSVHLIHPPSGIDVYLTVDSIEFPATNFIGLGAPPLSRVFVLPEAPLPIAGGHFSEEFFPVNGIGLGTHLYIVSESDSSGANPAHCIAQAFFSQPPFGVGANPDRYDLESLKAVSTICINEGYRASVSAEQGASAAQAIGDLLLDIGCMLRLDSGTGLLQFRMLRPDTVSVTTIPEDAVQGRLDETTNVISATRPSRIIYTFKDRDQDYRDQPIHVNADGLVEVGGVVGETDVAINSTVDFATAAVEALRREQELFSDLAVRKIRAGFNARKIRPGDVVFRGDETLGYLVTEVGPPEDDEAGLELLCVPNGLLAPTTGLELFKQGELIGVPPATIEALQWRLWLLPAGLQASSAATAAAALWVRGSVLAAQAVTFLSVDDASFNAVAFESGYATGGTLLQSIPAGSFVSGDTDSTPIQFNILGPDIGQVQDLTGAVPAWEAGQQLLIVFNPSSAAHEIIFLQSVNLLTDTTAQLAGMKRGMYGTPVLTHPIGSDCYIVRTNTWVEVVNALLQPALPLFYKIQALGNGNPVPIQNIPSKTVTPP